MTILPGHFTIKKLKQNLNLNTNNYESEKQNPPRTARGKSGKTGKKSSNMDIRGTYRARGGIPYCSITELKQA